MSTGDLDDKNWLEKFREGDEQAAGKLFQRHANQLLELARQRISQRFASRVDPEDVVQSVFRTFFKRARQGEFTLREKDDLVKLLVRITVYKTLRQIAFHQQAKRDARQESGTGEVNQDQLLAVMSKGATPEEAVIFLDELETFLDQQSPTDCKICEMRIEGYSNAEIAEALGINERRIRRLMERLRGLAKREKWFD